MRLGALIGPAGASPAPHALVDQSRSLEGEGFDGLWVAQAVGRGMMVPDPFVSLAAAAAVTGRVQLGTAVIQVPLYEPSELAHRIFSLRQLAGNRLVVGVGAGSTESDFRVFGRDYASRFARFHSGLAALRDLLAKGSDDHVDLSPWPNVLGVPPFLYGTWGKDLTRAARDFDGWIASALHRSDEQVIEALQDYRASGGRRAIVSSIFLGPEEPPGANRRRLEAFAEAGFDEAVVVLLPGGPTAGEVRRWVPA
jgi:alkanesulfonate monooxygenase SsuD/methylene tetrahydromethanopterin reductase-like flavin-dependent oxidoreductase (luciferase family)